MQLYDETISEWLHLLEKLPYTELQIDSNSSWADCGKQNMVLQSDMAYELGGRQEQFAALGGTAVTSSSEFVPYDQILLYGQNLSEITEDLPYARLTVCRVDSTTIGEGNELYNAVKNIEYTRYHVSPEGFMIRVSTIKKRESARISKNAVKKNLNFSDVGKLLIESYRKNPKIQAVKIIFINLKDFPYSELEKSIKKTELITKAIDHIQKDSIMDCSTCGLQKVCDEVEGMRELHFRHNAEK